MMYTTVVFLGLVAGTYAADNGRALTPPMGWRSWNLYGRDVNQDLIEGIMDGMVSQKRSVDGVKTSLCDLGYCDVGLDDNWQSCGAGDGTEFHATDGKPIVNLDLFPNMKDMTNHAHNLSLTAGWYGNNCICSERNTNQTKYYKGDVDELIRYGFDGVKLDGCGAQTNLEMYYDLMNATGHAITIENCHWGSRWPFAPTKDFCPWNLYRTSGDVRAKYSSVVGNLQTTIEYAEAGLSRPGCWAYPDMLEVGCAHGPGGDSDPGLTLEETRSHFAAWAIVSSPLVLSHDVNNDTIMDAIWDIIANPETIAVNQAYVGHSGSPFKSSSRQVVMDQTNTAKIRKGMSEEEAHKASAGAWTAPSFQYFYKPVGNGQTAVLLMNHDETPNDLELDFADVPGLGCSTGCKVRDIFARKDLGSFDGSYTATAIASHDSAFLMISQ